MKSIKFKMGLLTVLLLGISLVSISTLGYYLRKSILLSPIL